MEAKAGSLVTYLAHVHNLLVGFSVLVASCWGHCCRSNMSSLSPAKAGMEDGWLVLAAFCVALCGQGMPFCSVVVTLNGCCSWETKLKLT